MPKRKTLQPADLPIEVQELQAVIIRQQQQIDLLSPAEWSEIQNRSAHRAAAARKAAEAAEAGRTWSEENQYPDLTGSAKQVSWAISLRREIIEEVRAIGDMIFAREAEQVLRTVTDAHEWIELRKNSYFATGDIVQRLEEAVITGRLLALDDVLDRFRLRLRTGNRQLAQVTPAAAPTVGRSASVIVSRNQLIH
jgi:hypothetical protein